MIATSTLVMFALMYLNTYQADHAISSVTRAFMAPIMDAAMAVVMLHMYEERRKGVAILVAAVALFAGSFWLVRSQRTIDDAPYLRAMLPHHSIAILTSERAQIRDPRVRELADEIIEAQRREISEMKQLIAELEVAPSDP